MICKECKLTASIVLYHTSQRQLETVLKCVADAGCVNKLYIIDNSPSEETDIFCSKYLFVEYLPHENTGYGSSHNIALHKAIEGGSDYHVVLNPDIYFEENVLTELVSYMNAKTDVSYVLPRVIYPNGELQYLCKLLPTPSDLIFRRFLPKTKWTVKKNAVYELHHSGYDKIINPPCLSGCFMFLRLSTLKENNLFFDDRYFMYCEDFDLIRRIHRVAKTVYYPNVTIVHNHAKASYKNCKMLMTHIKSAIRYFNKFGWFFDKERHEMNKKILKEIKEMSIVNPMCGGGD